MGCFSHLQRQMQCFLRGDKRQFVGEIGKIWANFQGFSWVFIDFERLPVHLSYFGGFYKVARPAKTRQNRHLPVPNGGMAGL